MIHIIKSITDSFFSLLSEDPVRPEIPFVERIGDNKDVFVLRENDKTMAITCVSYQDFVPSQEVELFQTTRTPSIAVFYTIWSYAPGSGRQLIFDAVSHIRDSRKDIERFVTLSPKTENAKRFHLRNGAFVFRENEKTVNFEYVKVKL